ncbi:hypothetical protein PAXRUDRAFT_832144 [Paxillus rubicundulus Ve08.2h10]|uniref:Uncharacterized protein n=1 Tax=Paxillus rubicundulus Ve08.2h10 TaxID=930991 RepID=A0A0D0DLM1_9AGAM|nr:hypothetical protein PAXRUDRAFT_832144 [Paxillus rubicundulus Ve08.2h10]
MVVWFTWDCSHIKSIKKFTAGETSSDSDAHQQVLPDNPRGANQSEAINTCKSPVPGSRAR